MQTRNASWLAFAAASVIGFGLACVVDLPPDGKYTCTSDADCGGEQYICTPAAAGARYCCRPNGNETCDGQDNDCNGVTDDLAATSCYTGTPGTPGVGRCRSGTQACADGGVICAGQVLPTAETCNQLDDNCNGQIDDGFDLNNDPQNCGRCGIGCLSPLRCQDGGCSFPVEANCADGVDNEGDNATDCADSDCANQACGTGCRCNTNFQRTEIACGDTQDNDSDTNTDCADVDCDGGSCGTGCQCLGGGKTELLCSDTQDNDTDTNADCADNDCNGQSCGTGCACAGGEKTETVCDDLADNDGDGLLNCADSNCDGGICGAGCVCQGGQRGEATCSDNQDNDGDMAVDCADTQCDGGSCGSGCQCLSGRKTETNCIVNPLSGDEDGDGNANCADSDCLGRTCRTSPLRTCQMNGSCQ